MACLKTSNDWAPITGVPFTRKVGVLRTPKDCAALVSASTMEVYLPASRQSLKAFVSNPSSAAKRFRFALLNAPPFSPDWLSNSLSWYSQNAFWSAAHSLASPAHCDSGPRKVKCWYPNRTVPFFINSSSIWRPAPVANCPQYGHW